MLLKSSPSLHGVVIDKKLFEEVLKINKRSQDKAIIDSINAEYEEKFDELREILLKIIILLEGKPHKVFTMT